MKGLGKYFLFAVGLLFGSMIGIQNVSAATLNYDFSGYYYERFDQNGNNYSSWKLENYYVDGEVAYCIEPGIPEGNPYYQVGSWSDVGLSNEVGRRISLIAYYGYTYPNHQTQKYRATTQGMIWATILGNNTTVKFSTERYGEGTPLDISAETNEINRLMEEHYKVPSFDSQTITAQVGKTITLTDTNNVLSNFDVSVSGAEYSINGNTLTIKPTTDGTINVSLTKRMPYDHGFKIFYGDGIQNMLVAGSVDPVISTIRVKSYYTNVSLNKSDSETGNIAQGQATLGGAVYGVYKNDGTLVTKITTDVNGNGTSASVLRYDEEYYVKEITASNGYYLDESRYVINAKDNNTTLGVKETVVKNFISILKQYDYVDGNTTFLNAEKGITFEIYYPDGRKYGDVTTDKNGYATLEIPFGVWKFHQLNTNTGFEKIYDFFITVDYDSAKEQYYNILNNKISAYLNVVKVDTETNKTIELANTSFKILNVDTKQYVSQYVAGHVYDTFYTDENGTLTTYLKLEAGNYKLVEINSPIGYLKDNDGLDFTIGSDTHYYYTTYGAFIKVFFKNAPIKGQVEVNKTGEQVVINDGSFNYEVKSLSGVKFQVYADEDILSADKNYMYYHKGDLVDTIITNDNGYAISKKLPLGKYFIVEVATQDNYILDTEEYHFTLSQIDDKTSIVYESHSKLNYLKKGELLFSKEDLTTGVGIEGTKIDVFTESGEKIFSGYTDEEGHITIKDLFVGKFYIIETEAATGYRLSDEIVYFEILEDGEIVKANMTNEKITSIIKIHKVDENNKALSGVEIGIYDLEENLVYSSTSDEEGNIEVELEYGSYYIQEIKTVEGYVLNTEKIYFNVSEDGATIENTIVNNEITSTIKIHKVDENGNALKGVVIGIYDLEGNLLGSYETDESGDIEVELKYGSYYFQEISTIDGYELNDEKVYFDVTEDGEYIQKTLVNEEIEIEVPNTLANSYFIILPFALLTTGGIILLVSKKKKNKKVNID